MNISDEVLPTVSQSATDQAEKIYKIMRHRNNVFGTQLFSDPAWNILLDLFIAQQANRRLTVSDVCVGSQRPLATCLRYISILADAGLIIREGDNKDRRRVFIDLTSKAVLLMVELLDENTTRLRELRIPFDYDDAVDAVEKNLS